MKRIAVTGSSGYIGSRLVAGILSRGDVESIVGIDIAPPAATPAAPVSFIQTDIRRPFAESFVREGIDTAIHLAFSFAPTRGRRGLARAVNLDGTRHFLEACHAAKVRRAVVLTSASAYGARRDNPELLTEESPLRARPSFPYSYDKRLCDQLCGQFAAEHPSISLAWCRPPIVLGANVDNYFSRMLFKPKVVHFRGHDPAMQFIHEDDLCEALLVLLNSDAPGPFNVAPVETLRFTQLAAEFKRAPAAVPAILLQISAAITYWAGIKYLNETPPGALDYMRFPWLLDSGKFARETGFRCSHSSLEAVRSWRGMVLKQIEEGKTMPGKWRV